MPNQNLQPNNPDNIYLYKKTEKIVSALYLLSSFISDKEPLKWQIREAGLKLLSQILSLSDRPIQGVYLITLILSFLEAGYIGGIISSMNFSILKTELENLVTLVDLEEKNRLKGAVFTDNFFVPDLPDKSLFSSGISKGHNILSNRRLSFKNNESKIKDKSNRLFERTNRQDIIIDLLKKNKELGIKDFVSAIKDCSEKTVQRELATLVAKGQVKKEGEKRWSRYSLK
jgi:predicted transcriptional regulator